MHRPGWVTLVAVLHFVYGVGGVVTGVMMILGGGVFAGGFGPLGTFLGVFLVFGGVLVLLFSAFLVLLGVFLLKGRGWARVTTFVLAGVSAFFILLSLVDTALTFGLDLWVLLYYGLSLGVATLQTVGLARRESAAFFAAPPPLRAYRPA